MNSKLLLAAIVGGFFLLSGKKSSGKSTVTDTTGDVTDSEDTETETEDVPAKETPTYKKLTTSRKKIIESYMTLSPMETNEPFPWGNYLAWATLKTKENPNFKPVYQDWLANIVYWQITRVEGKTDLFTDVYGVNAPGFDGTLPYILQKGKKGIIDLENPNPDPKIGGFKIVDITETQAQSNKRLAQGIALWKEINSYIRKNFKGCPQGAYCELN